MIQKTDPIKFGKHKGKTWGELLEFEDGKNWLKWWIETPSQGQYANYENKQKATIREWLGEAPADTRAGSQVINMAFVLNKLEIIERGINVLMENQGIKTEWEKEGSDTTDSGENSRVQWEE